MTEDTYLPRGNADAPQRIPPFKKDRVEFFSDAVFGVAITLLFVDLSRDVSHITQESDTDWQFIHRYGEELWPLLISMLPAIVIVGTFWIAHHNVFHLIKRVTRGLLWINTGLLASIAMMPILTHFMLRAIKEDHPAIAAAAVGFGFFICSAMLLSLWRFASKHKLLLDVVDDALERRIRGRMKRGLVVYGVATVVCLIQLPWVWVVGVVAYIVMQALYMRPGDIDNLVRTLGRKEAAPVATAGQP